MVSAVQIGSVNGESLLRPLPIPAESSGPTRLIVIAPFAAFTSRELHLAADLSPTMQDTSSLSAPMLGAYARDQKLIYFVITVSWLSR